MLPITTPVTDEGVTDEDVCCQAREGPARGLLSQVDPCPRGFLFPFQVGPWCHFTHFGQQPGTCNTNTDLISQGRTVASLHRAHPVWGMMDEGEQAGSISDFRRTRCVLDQHNPIWWLLTTCGYWSRTFLIEMCCKYEIHTKLKSYYERKNVKYVIDTFLLLITCWNIPLDILG